MPFDPTEPDQNRTLQSSDDILRADKAFLKAGLEREHHFDGSETPGSGKHLMHKQGSARVFIYDNAVQLTTGTLASTYSLAEVRNTGLTVVDKQGGGNGARVWYCWDGANDGWIELGQLGSALRVLGETTLEGNTNFGGHLTTGATKKLIVPVGEEWLTQNAVNMNPHAHGATRHQVTGAEGAWVRALDPLRGLLVRDPKVISNLVPAALTGAFVNQVSLTYNLTGRTQNSRIVLASLFNLRQAGASFAAEAEARLTVNAAVSALAPLAKCGLPNRVNAQIAFTSGVLLDWFDVAAGTNFTYAMQARVESGTGDFFSGYLYLFDFGEVS